jgi:hypothetical protein
MHSDSLRRLLNVRRNLFMVVVSLIATTMLVGCSAAPPSPDNNELPSPKTSASALNSISGVDAEYKTAMAEYALPAGYKYPADPFKDKSGSYQRGYGTTEVVRFWNCAWARTYLAAQGVNPKRADAALTQFAAIMDTDVYKLYYDPLSAYPLFESAVSKAELGDPSDVQAVVDGGCPAV